MAKDLDDFFGPRIESPIVINKCRTNWPTAPEYLRPILDTWQELVGFRATGSIAGLWRKAAQDWYENFGSDTELLRVAFQTCRDKHSGIVIKSPRSVMFLALDWKARGRAHGLVVACESCGAPLPYHNAGCKEDHD